MKNDRFDILTTRAVAHGGRLVRDARKFLRQGGRALVWSTEPLLAEARRESGMHRVEFHREPGAETRGIAVFECFT
jgi:16S rRNA G527 N7-methylase RsmG